MMMINTSLFRQLVPCGLNYVLTLKIYKGINSSSQISDIVASKK